MNNSVVSLDIAKTSSIVTASNSHGACEIRGL
jgi:hypothetical protein